MGDMTMQAVIWVAAASLLVVYLKRRKKRKMVP